jgi:hypothetical protein
MVAALTQQGILSGRLSALLNGDLARAQLAPNTIKRARAIRQFRKDSKRLRGSGSWFLRVAAYPLSR